MTFQEFLTYASGPGINVILGFVLSFVAECKPVQKWLDNLEAWASRLVFLGASLFVPVVAIVVSCGFGYQPWSFDQAIWPALVAGFLAFGTGTLGHVRVLWKNR